MWVALLSAVFARREGFLFELALETLLEVEPDWEADWSAGGGRVRVWTGFVGEVGVRGALGDSAEEGELPEAGELVRDMVVDKAMGVR